MMEFKNNKFIYTTDALMSNSEIKRFYILFAKSAPEDNKDGDSVSFLWTLSREERESLGDTVSVLRFLRADGVWDVSSFNEKHK